MASGPDLLLIQLAAIFVAAKVASYIASLAKVPPLVGEVGAGVLLANTGLFNALQLGQGSEVLEAFAELGVIFLIFIVGLEVEMKELMKVGRTAGTTAILGVVVPFVAGAAVFWAYGFDVNKALFVGVAFVATSIGITARVLTDLGALQTQAARIILGAAVLDDVLGLLLLAVVSSVLITGAISLLEVGIIVASAVGFLAIAGVLGRGVVRFATRAADGKDDHRWSAFLHRPDFPVVLGISVVLVTAAAATEFGLAAIIGAFLAGLLFEGTPQAHELERRMEALTHFFAPFFFVFIGLQVDLGSVIGNWALVLVVTVVAFLSKLIGCGAGAWNSGRDTALQVGIGMTPRGEVGIIVALIGLQLGIVAEQTFGVVVAMSVLTTIVAPPLLTWAFKRGRPKVDETAL